MGIRVGTRNDELTGLDGLKVTPVTGRILIM